MKRPLEKKERGLGMKLFLKGDRCNSPKCAMTRKPYAPGMHGKKRKKSLSEFGTQLLEKQRIRTSYGLSERQLSGIFKKAVTKTGSVGEQMIDSLERQLSNVVFRLGFTNSRFVAKQFISHGHFLVNGRKLTIPSYKVRVGDVISIKPKSREILIFKDLPNIIKKYEPPKWLDIDKEKLDGKVRSLPQDVEIPFDINLVVDYYSK